MAKKDTSAAGDPQAVQDPGADQQQPDSADAGQQDDPAPDQEAETDAAWAEEPVRFNWTLNRVNELLDSARMAVDAAHRTRDPGHTATAVGHVVDALKLLVARMPS